MIAKKDRNIDVYKNAGAYMRLLKTAGTKALIEISKVLYAKDTDRLIKALNTIDEICSRAEYNMFRDYPDLSNEYIDVFYGDVSDIPRNDVDEEIINLAREKADELFKRD